MAESKGKANHVGAGIEAWRRSTKGGRSCTLPCDATQLMLLTQARRDVCRCLLTQRTVRPHVMRLVLRNVPVAPPWVPLAEQRAVPNTAAPNECRDRLLLTT